MKRIGVLHLTDTLEMAGKERVAVNLVNLLPRERYRTYLCSTRRDGPLLDVVDPQVGRLCLDRRYRFDIQALNRLIAFIRSNNIQLLHPHGMSLFIALVAARFAPYPAVVWHDHYGGNKVLRKAWPYQLVARSIHAIVAVSEELADWSRRKLPLSAEKVWYIPNFAQNLEPDEKALELPGQAGKRIVCVAHLRPQKDHLNILEAMALVRSKVPGANLLLVGSCEGQVYLDRVRKKIEQLGLSDNVSLLGARRDVNRILQVADIGMLGSASEGFPLALIEYGMAGLPAVATEVGQCSEVLGRGHAGILLPPHYILKPLFTLH